MKRKANAILKAQQFDGRAKYYADILICAYHLDEAERLAERILEKIRSQKLVKEK